MIDLNSGENELRNSVPLNDRISAFIKTNNFSSKLNKVFTTRLSDRSYLYQIEDLYFNHFGPAVMQKFHDEILGVQEQGIYIRGRQKLVQPLVKWLIDSLINQHKYNFQYIFKTSRGSTYFVLPSGESMRFKTVDPNIDQGLIGGFIREKPIESYTNMELISDKCYFIDAEEQKKIFDERLEKGNYIDVQTIKFKNGAIPLEIQAAYSHQTKGPLPIDINDQGIFHLGENVRAFHPGTPIIETIYQK